MRVHLDTDFLVFAVGRAGKERRRLTRLAASEAVIEMSAVAWYEFARGPRTPEQLAVAGAFQPQRWDRRRAALEVDDGDAGLLPLAAGVGEARAVRRPCRR